MQAVTRRCAIFLALALAAHPVGAIRQHSPGPSPEAHVKHAVAAANSTAKPTSEEVEKLHRKLEVVVSGLRGMLDAKNGTLANAKVAPTMKMFIKELEGVLANTSSIKDPTVAMRNLNAASASLKTLMHELTARQEALMLEDESQRESLLLGVLMSKQKEPMDRQLEVLRSPDFASLSVAQELLVVHNATPALYVQAAAFLDGRRGKKVTTALEGEAAGRAATAERLASALQQRVETMEREYRGKQVSHEKRLRTLEVRTRNATSKSERHLAEVLRRREARAFKKFAVTRSRDIASMKSAVDAVRRGDVKALQRARAALLASLQALKSQNNNFLVLLALGHRSLGGDCPYCAAQCIDKCRQKENSYVKCLGDCADAGKR